MALHPGTPCPNSESEVVPTRSAQVHPNSGGTIRWMATPEPSPASMPPSPSGSVVIPGARVEPSLRVDAVIPVYNEEHVLAQSVTTLRAFLTEHLSQYRWRIVIADNASTDGTLAVAQRLAELHPTEVSWLHLDQKGRGRALKRAWLESDADILTYMDVDLSTGLDAYPLLVQSIINGYDVATGSRLMAESRTTRSAKREVISRAYNLLIKLTHWVDIADAQCGFKAVSRASAHELAPLIENNEWFFDTELLLLAKHRGFRVKGIPVVWVEDPDSRVHIVKTAVEDIKGLLRMRFHPPQ